MVADVFWVFVAWLIAGFACGVVGFGGMIIAFPLLCLGMPATDAVLSTCIIGVPTTAQLAWLYRAHVVWKDIRLLWIGCVPGCFFGAWVLTVVPVQYLQISVGLLILVFVAMQLLGDRTTWQMPDLAWVTLATGVASGFANSSLAVVGVPIGIYVLLRRFEPDRGRATMGMLFFASSLVTMCAQACMGLYTRELFLISASGLFSSILGQYLGYRIGRHLNRRLFVILTLSFLTLAASLLCWKGVVALLAR